MYPVAGTDPVSEVLLPGPVPEGALHPDHLVTHLHPLLTHRVPLPEGVPDDPAERLRHAEDPDVPSAPVSFVNPRPRRQGTSGAEPSRREESVGRTPRRGRPHPKGPLSEPTHPSGWTVRRWGWDGLTRPTTPRRTSPSSGGRPRSRVCRGDSTTGPSASAAGAGLRGGRPI